MENFGLGLVLNFQDNATSKIDSVIGMMESLQRSINEVANSASGSIQHISGMSNALLTLGAGITALGGAGVATFTGLTKSIVGMSSQFERNITALTQMYGDAQVAQEKFLAYERMAASTPLGMEVIQSAATRLKTVGVEAEKTFDVLVDGTKTSRALLEILGDLSVMRPDKTMEDVIREGIEFIEGNARPIKMSFGLDVDSKNSINEKLADTAEGRLDQLVRMIEKAGYTGALDKTNESWDSIMQNLGDNFKVLSYYVGMVGGIFEDVKTPFKELSKYLNKLIGQKDVMANIGKSIAVGLRIVIAPAMAVLSLVGKLIVAFVELTKEHPKLVSLGIAFVGIASQLMLVAGVGLVSLGVFLKFRVMVIRLIADFRTFIATTRFASMSFGMLLRSILPVTIAMGFLYYAWRTNFLGLRTIVGGTLQYIANLFDIVTDAMTHIDIEKGIFSLSKKHHNLAEQMGIMELLQTLATAYHYAVMFGRGMKEGFASAQQVISDINTKIDNFLQSLSGTPLEGFANDIKRVKKDFTTMFNPQTANDVQYLGKAFSQLAFWATGAFIAFRTLRTGITVFNYLRTGANFILSSGGRIISLFSRFGSAVGRMVTYLSRVSPLLSRFSSSIPLFQSLGRTIQSFAVSPRFFVQGLLSVFNSLPGRIGASIMNVRLRLIAMFESVGTMAAQRFVQGFSFVTRGFSAIGRGIVTVLNTIANPSRLITMFKTLGSTLLRIATNGGLRALFNIGGLVARINPVGLALTALGLIITFIINHWEEFQAVAATVWSHVQETVSGVVTRLQPVFDRLKEAFGKLVERFPFLGEIVNTVVGFITTAFGMLTGTVSMDSEQASAVLNTLGAVFEFVFDLAMTVVEIAIGVIASMLTGFFEVLSGVIDFIEGVFTGNWSQAWEGIKEIFSGIWDSIKGIADSVLGSISGFLDRIIGKAGDAKAAAQDAGDSLPDEPENNALGGIYSKPLLTWVAEAGYPEAIVPLDGSARGVALWEQAGRMLGALPNSLTSAEKVTAPIPTPAPVRTVPIPVSAPQPTQAPSGGGITFEAGSIQFNVTTDNFDADKAAQMIMPIIQRKVEIMRMTSRRGGALA